mmetsp:Transcript_7828/g.23534  ORF Transcript_7828/g.23534 Transcript_7828/m.23534 type:complete len:213 (-) Transcript_7828:293-931(-)
MAMAPRTASCMLTWPSRFPTHVGACESSKSDMYTAAPLLRALMTILRGTGGPVISTRRSTRPGAGGAAFHTPSRTARVSGRKSGICPASSAFCRTSRAASSWRRRASKHRCSAATNAWASGVSTRAACSWLTGPWMATPGTHAIVMLATAEDVELSRAAPRMSQTRQPRAWAAAEAGSGGQGTGECGALPAGRGSLSLFLTAARFRDARRPE